MFLLKHLICLSCRFSAISTMLPNLLMHFLYVGMSSTNIIRKCESVLFVGLHLQNDESIVCTYLEVNIMKYSELEN